MSDEQAGLIETTTGRALTYRSVTVSGRTLRIAIRPALVADDLQPPLLICNGIGANMELLAPLANALPDRSLVLFDAPGTGASPAPLLPYRLKGLARNLIELMDELGYHGQIDVMGISWGGMLAQAITFAYETRVRKLVLAATSPGWLMVPGSPHVLVKLMSPRRYTDPDFMREHAGTIYGGQFRTRSADTAKTSDPMLAPSTRGYLYQMLASWGWTGLPWLWRLPQPTLVLHGTDDPIVPVSNARILSTIIPNARLHVFDDGHMFMITSAEETGREIEAFLSIN